MRKIGNIISSLILFVLIIFSANAEAQTTTSTIEGTITDANGAAIAGADETPKPKPANEGVRIDFDGIRQRIISVKALPADYSNLAAGSAGTFFYTEPIPGTVTLRLQKFMVAANSAVPFMEGISTYTISADKKKLLYGARGGRWGIIGTDAPKKVGEGMLNVAELEMKVDPRAEWENIFRETWRIQREFFYDPKMQGADWNAIYKKYLPMLKYAGHRADLGYLIAQMGGELTVGHSYLTDEGDVPGEDPVSVGMLGADIETEDGKYKIIRIYNGENWNPELRSPLSSPGIDVKEGDFILEVNGKPLDTATNFYSHFENTAIVLKNPNRFRQMKCRNTRSLIRRTIILSRKDTELWFKSKAPGFR